MTLSPQKFLLLAVATFLVVVTSAGRCLENDEFETAIAGNLDGPTEGSCCQEHICSIPCPNPLPKPGMGFGIAVGISIAISFIVGVLSYVFVKGESVNYFIAGRSLPLWLVSVTLAAASIDSNGLLGNVDLSYKFQFFDGAVIPIGLGLSLIINGITLAHHINDDNVLTLPDVFAKRYGKTVEVLVSLCTMTSFCILLAGNFVGMGRVISYLWGIEKSWAIWVTAAIVWGCTVMGGLFAIAFADVVQALMGWSGCIVCAYWFIANSDPAASPPSIGYENYVYPDSFPGGEICSMYDGKECTYVDGCCYNTEKYCDVNGTNCAPSDNGAYPLGDQRIVSNEMTDHLALSPFPNAMYWNWATIFILAFGNLAALDFQGRCMASKTPRIARLGCLISGCITFFVGIPFAYLGSITRIHYGPDSAQALFEADTCSEILGLPTCALWKPDPDAFIKLMVHDTPPFIGAWCLVGIVAASMSTASGAILAMGTVFSHNVMRQLDVWWPNLVTAQNLLLATRLSTFPFALAATLIGAYYRSPKSAGATGYLLIVAFDVVLATVVAPLFGAYYAKNPSPRAAFLTILVGAFLRIVLEFTLPKDGFLLLPYRDPEFQDVGPAASANFPVFLDVDPDLRWNTTAEPCHSRQFEDYTGVDSLTSFVVSCLVFVTVQYVEHKTGGPLFNFPGSEPYEKNLDEEVVLGMDAEDTTVKESTKHVLDDQEEEAEEILENEQHDQASA